MKRDLETYLFDIQAAGEDILEFTEGLSLEDYRHNALVKAAVERKFAVIGEALVRLREAYPTAIGQITDADKIIGFRNVLVHGYDAIDDRTVWSAISGNLPALLQEVVKLGKI